MNWQLEADMHMIQAIELTKKYEDGLVALDRLTLNVESGQVYILLGANGAGKTTTINLFLDFIKPTSGSARINGIDCNGNPLESRKYIAYIPENVMLYRNLTGWENLEFFTHLSGLSHNADREDYLAAVRQIGLPEETLGRRLKTFSKGMRQKLAIAMAILKQAKVLLLDEPTSGLDPKAASDFMGLLMKLRNEGIAILMSTHDVFRAREIADSVGIMKEGVLIVEKSKADLEHENLEKLYLGYMDLTCSN